MNTTTGTYVPSPSERVRDQVALYESTGGAEGGQLGGLPVVILTTYGAKSGAVRKTPIMRMTDGDDYIAIASYAGAPANPAWYHNLTARPEGFVQDGGTVVAVRAVEVEGGEKQRLWRLADSLNPAYAGYRAATSRDIPILRLRRDN